MTGDGQESVLLRYRGAVAEVILNRPTRRNALTVGVMGALREAFTGLGASEARAVVLRGADGFFCSGLDTAEMDPGAPALEMWSSVHYALAAVEIPVVACLQGGAINAGAALALACDLVIAGESSYIQMMEAAIGVNPPMNAAWLALRHPAGVGMQLALSCRPFRGDDLLRLGIALDVLPDDDVLAHTLQLASRIASYPASGGRSTKGTLRRASGEAHRFAAAVDAALAAPDGAVIGDRR